MVVRAGMVTYFLHTEEFSIISVMIVILVSLRNLSTLYVKFTMAPRFSSAVSSMYF